MKRSLFILATLAMSSALYAQADAGLYNREKVLNMFSQYNPSVLQNAQHNEHYNAILESFLVSYASPETEENRFELIALARNFDNSIQLQNLTDTHKAAVIFSEMGGGLFPVSEAAFLDTLVPVFARIWAVTVQLREYQIEEYEAQIKALRKDKNLTEADRDAKIAALKNKIKTVKSELKALKTDPGQQVFSAAVAYEGQVHSDITAELDANRARIAQEKAAVSRASSNLQVKTKNKKPVAK